jgi:hypothetical protein
MGLGHILLLQRKYRYGLVPDAEYTEKLDLSIPIHYLRETQYEQLTRPLGFMLFFGSPKDSFSGRVSQDVL